MVAYDKGKYLLCTCGDAVKVIDVDTGLVKHSLSQVELEKTIIYLIFRNHPGSSFLPCTFLLNLLFRNLAFS